MTTKILTLLIILWALGLAGCAITEPNPNEGSCEGGSCSDPQGKDSVGKPSPFQEESPARATLEWLPILAAAGIALSVLVFFLSKPKIGIAGVASFITLMVVSLGLMMFAWWIAVIGGTAVMLATLAISIPLYRALKQTVLTTQAAKERLTEDDKVEVFEDGGLADQIQSNQTKSLVQTVKPRNAEPQLQ